MKTAETVKENVFCFFEEGEVHCQVSHAGILKNKQIRLGGPEIA